MTGSSSSFWDQQSFSRTTTTTTIAWQDLSVEIGTSIGSISLTANCQCCCVFEFNWNSRERERERERERMQQKSRKRRNTRANEPRLVTCRGTSTSTTTETDTHIDPSIDKNRKWENRGNRQILQKEEEKEEGLQKFNQQQQKDEVPGTSAHQESTATALIKALKPDT